ncbi:hypothetical protein M405DRAFT_928637 [Rhizopogon salebrosus TDB-379]|nr:hypothetical protein M405DRAFT_928637 [Rhizopogon salebrosus TDB-379]
MGRRRGKLAASTDPEYESRIQAALADVANGTHKNITVAAMAHKVARQTLRDRSKGLHVPRGDFSKSQQLLNPSEEEAVRDWLAHQSGAARPLHSRDLRARVTEITGKHPGQNWHRRFLARHKKSLSTHKPRNLDPETRSKLQQDNCCRIFQASKGPLYETRSISASHPPHFFAQPGTHHGLNNPPMYQYPPPHLFHQQYFTPNQQ